jgi:hypothetical protein
MLPDNLENEQTQSLKINQTTGNQVLNVIDMVSITIRDGDVVAPEEKQAISQLNLIFDLVSSRQ